MAVVKHVRVVNASQERVFEALTRHEDLPKFMPQILEVQKLTDGPVRQGTRFRQVQKMLFPFVRTSFEYEIDEYDPPRKLTTRSDSRFARFSGGDTLEAVEGGTQVTVEVQVELKGLAKPLGFLMVRMAKKNLENSARVMKAMLEA